MPTYDYQCRKCDHTWEMFQSITAKPVKKCPECGKLSVKRVIGPGAGILFKGSGFYQTDYRSDSYKKGAEAAKKASEPAKSDTAGSNGGGDAKSSPKSESKAGE